MNKYKDMIAFSDIDCLCEYIIDTAEKEVVNMIAHREIVLETLRCIEYSCDIEIGCLDIDFIDDYDKEYTLCAYYGDSSDLLNVSVEKSFDEAKNCYLGMDGYILIHEETNSKALRDILDNHNSEISDYDWFVIGEDDAFVPCNCKTGSMVCDNVDEKQEEIGKFFEAEPMYGEIYCSCSLFPLGFDIFDEKWLSQLTHDIWKY